MMLRAVLFAFVCAAPAAAQTVSPGLELANPEMTAAAERQVRMRVEDFVGKRGSRDTAGMRALLAPKAVVAEARRQADGTLGTTYWTGDEFLADMEQGRREGPFQVSIANMTVGIDGEQIAHVRLDYRAARSGRTAASGVDRFTLVKEKDGWKIAAWVYTAVPQRP